MTSDDRLDAAPEDVTTVVPATAAAGLPHEHGDELRRLHALSGDAFPGAAARSWFDDRLHAFLGAIAFDADHRPRPPLEQRALATAARDMIERLSLRTPGEASPDWPGAAVLQPNQLLANTYIVRAMVARGGIGEIYRARHRDLRTDHAVKILLPQHTLDMTLATMLQEEARHLSRVRHAGVVGCQGLLRDADGRLLLVMDYVRGATLSARLREGPMAVGDLVAMTHGLAAALGAVHAAGIVHNDLSPDNIILADDHCATPVIVDFGVARPMVEPDDVQLLVDFAGKYSWISPEQLGPAAGAPPDPRSDLYSLGLVLAAAALGRKLDMGSDAETARAARRTVPPLEGVPEKLARLAAALLAPDLADRPASAAAALALLDGAPARPGLLDRLRRIGRGG